MAGCDLARKTIRARQQRMDHGDVSTPNSGAGCSVELAWGVVEMLRERTCGARSLVTRS